VALVHASDQFVEGRKERRDVTRRVPDDDIPLIPPGVVGRARRQLQAFVEQRRYEPALAMTRPMSELVDPAVKSDRIKRSIDTDGSPASILATRDWLDLMRRASAACERFLFNRRRLSSRAKETRTSTKAASASVRPRNSLASATFQPARWSFSFLSFRISTSSTSLRQVTPSSLILSSRHLGPISGSALQLGIPRFSPFCSIRSRNPASRRAASENGGLLTSPCNQTSGLS